MHTDEEGVRSKYSERSCESIFTLRNMISLDMVRRVLVIEFEQSQRAIDFDMAEEHKIVRSDLEGYQPDEEDGPGPVRRACQPSQRDAGALPARGIIVAY